MDKHLNKLSVEQDFLIMTLILNENQCRRFEKVYKDYELSEGIIIIGRGTVSGTMLNLLGIKSQRKELISVLIARDGAAELLDKISDFLELSKPGNGILYTTSVITAAQIEKGRDISTFAQGTGGENMFKKMTVIVDRGMSEEVMDIARELGVKGGTILHGRGTGSGLSVKLLGMEIEPEKEVVMILMPEELVGKIAAELQHRLELDLPGKGIIFVEPVQDVRGLTK